MRIPLMLEAVLTEIERARVSRPLRTQKYSFNDMQSFRHCLEYLGLSIVDYARVAERHDLPNWAKMLTAIKNDRLLMGWLRHNPKLNGVDSGELDPGDGEVPTITPVVGEGGTLTSLYNLSPVELVYVSPDTKIIRVRPLQTTMVKGEHFDSDMIYHSDPNNTKTPYEFRWSKNTQTYIYSMDGSENDRIKIKPGMTLQQRAGKEFQTAMRDNEGNYATGTELDLIARWRQNHMPLSIGMIVDLTGASTKRSRYMIAEATKILENHRKPI